jgi:hypothetical protein
MQHRAVLDQGTNGPTTNYQPCLPALVVALWSSFVHTKKQKEFRSLDNARIMCACVRVRVLLPLSHTHTSVTVGRSFALLILVHIHTHTPKGTVEQHKQHFIAQRHLAVCFTPC